MSNKGSAIGKKIAWQTWWSIVGPKLTSSEIRLQRNIVLSPMNDESFAYIKENRAPSPSVSTSSDFYIARYPPRDEVQSRHKMQIDVVASDEDEAYRLAQQAADRLLVSLSLTVPGGRYHAELRILRKLGDTEEQTAWSQSVIFASLAEPKYLSDVDIIKTEHIASAITVDPIAENSYIHLLSAWQLHTTAGSKPLDRSILHHDVLCIEAIVNGVMTKLRLELNDQIRQEERKFAKEFAETLAKRADQPEAIRAASTKLREISLANMVPSIVRISKIFNIADEIKDLAVEIYQFRSRSLSHPGREKKESFQKWLNSGSKYDNICLADLVSREFLVKYCESISKER